MASYYLQVVACRLCEDVFSNSGRLEAILRSSGSGSKYHLLSVLLLEDGSPDLLETTVEGRHDHELRVIRPASRRCHFLPKAAAGRFSR